MAALPAILVASMATFASAQKACEPDENTPGQVARATLALQIAQAAAKPEDALPKLKDAMKLLGEADKARNPVGRNYVLGRTLVLLMGQPSIGLQAKRSQLGYTTDPETMVDLVAAVDSAFTVVETAMPECITHLAGWRQQKSWVDLVNGAVEMSNQEKTDSAEVLARRSLQLYRGAPYGYFILGQAAAKKQQVKPAIALFKQAAAAAKDTSMADNRRQALYTIGMLAADAAESSSNETEKSEFTKEAKSAFEELAKDPGTKYLDSARNGLARVATMSGDTASLKASYQDQLANPSAFPYNTLMSAAVTAARANQNKDAVTLFEAAYKVNPYHRDVLYNLGRLYMLNGDYVKGMPVVQRLVTVDPANSDNMQLLAIGWAAQQKTYLGKQKTLDSLSKIYGQKANAAKVAATQRAYIDSAARLTPVMKAYSDSAARAVDSALKYNGLMTSLPTRVTFNEFTATDAKTTLSGTIANNTDAAKSFTFKIEFVDKGGNVVGTQDVTVTGVAPRASKSFTATIAAPGVVAFRYSPPA
jgi:tetratricopeptide (TPR) repeat protein